MVLGKYESNKRAIEDAAAIQQDTLAALERIEAQAAETEMMGITSLTELQTHREKMDRILVEGDRLHDNLDKTHKLQNRFGAWGLNFNYGAAKKEVDKMNRKSISKQDRQQQRDARISQSMTTTSTGTGSGSITSSRTADSNSRPSSGSTVATYASTPPSSEMDIVITKHSHKKDKKNKKKSSKVQLESAKNQGLLYGTTSTSTHNNNYNNRCACGAENSYDCCCKELNELADTDAAIDKHLDGIDKQLEGLMSLSRTINAETNNQTGAIDEIATLLESANEKQSIANSRARRFLTGGKRQEYDKKFTLFGVF